MSNFISRLLKGTAGISQNNSFECQSFIEVNPTVNRRSTDSHSQGHYTLSSRITRLAALFTLLFTLGVGQMWAGTKRIYFDYSLVTMWSDYTNLSGGAGFACVHCWGGKEGDADYTMSVVEGESYLACCDIDDGWTDVCFYRKGSDGSWWTKTFDYNSFGSKNYFKIKNESVTDGIDKYKWDSATRWAPGVCIDGLINVNNPYLQPFTFDDNDGTYEVTLSAHTTYQFCILDGSTRYTIDNNVWSGTIPGYTLGTTGYDIRLATAGAGSYKFEYNKSTHVIKVTYPTVNHPSIDYCYLYKFNDWTHHYLHIYDSENSIEGTTYPGTEIENYFEIGDDKYYYFAPGDYANCQPNDNNDSRKVDPAASTSAGLGKYQKYITDSWGWRTFTVRIQLENNGANVGEKGTEYVDVAFNSDALDDDIEVPVKDDYTFGCYYTEDGGAGTQLISAAGEWTTSAVEDYLDASHHWIHAGMSTTLYAKWTEIKHTVNVAVSPAGAGSVQVNSSNVTSVANVGIATKSAEMTPIALPGWKFKQWQVTSNVQMDLVNYHSDYQQGTANKMKINATADEQTITAVFEPRYYLVGKIWDNSAEGGMPGWENYNKPFKVVTTSPVLDTCKVTLTTNTSFYIEVRDKTDGFSYGKSEGTLNDNTTLTFTDKDNKVFVYSNGGTEYTFKITAIDGNGRPTVSIERPYQINYGWKYQNIDDAIPQTGNTGGTATVVNKDDEDATISAGAWVKYGTSTQYKSTPTSGYTVSWYSSDDYSTGYITGSLDFDHTATSTGNGYAKFAENVTKVALENNDGHGHIEVGGETPDSVTVGVNTTRSLTAVGNTGYEFKAWLKISGDDCDLDDYTVNPATLRGKGNGIKTGQRIEAQFKETARSITASAGTGGMVDAASYTAYIDTKADISATPATGYKFKEWQETGGTSNVTFDNPNSASTKIKATGNATIQAVFEPRWAIAGSWKTYPESAAWDADTYKMGNIGTNGSSKDTCYVEITLPANTDLTFKIVDRGEDGTVGVGSYVDYGNNTTGTQYMKYNNHTNWGFGLKSSGYYDCGITTTGGGTYKFAFNITDKSLTVTYQTSYQSNFGWKYADGAGSLHDGDNGGTITVTANDGGSHTISNGQWVAAGASITYTASPATGYAFAGWHNNSDCSTGKFNDNLYWTDGPLAATSNSYAKFVPVALTFTNNGGSGDGNWNTASNWSPACVPTIDHDVTIEKPVTVNINNAKAKSVVIYNDGSTYTGEINILGGKELIIATTLRKTTDGSSYGPTTANDLYIGSGASGNGALVMGSHDGTNAATVDFYSISHGATDDNTSVNQYIGIPFNSGSVLGCFYNSWVYEVDYTANPIAWKRNQTSLSPFVGYCLISADPSGHTYQMDGTLVATTNKRVDLHYSGSGSGTEANNENLLANSWTAPIRIGAMQADDFGGAYATIYIFNSTSPNVYTSFANNYTTYTINTAEGTDVIPSMQSFSVFSQAASETLTLDYEKIVYNPAVAGTAPIAANHAPQRRTSAEEANKLRLYVRTESGYGDMVYLLSRSDFENGFENGWDGHKLFGESVAPQMYAITPDGNMAINCVPTMEGTVLGFQKGSGDSEYAFSFDYEGLETLYLNDLKAQVSTLIDATNIYTFTAAADDDEARFIISATPIGQMPTEVETPSGSPSRGEKILINGQLYIIRHGRMYSAEGCLIK